MKKKVTNITNSIKTVEPKDIPSEFNKKLEEIGHTIRRNTEREYSKILGVDK